MHWSLYRFKEYGAHTQKWLPLAATACIMFWGQAILTTLSFPPSGLSTLMTVSSRNRQQHDVSRQWNHEGLVLR